MNNAKTWSRRRLLKGAALAPFAARALWTGALRAEALGTEALGQGMGNHKPVVLFVGTQTVAPSKSRGIYAFDWDAAEGVASPLGVAAVTDNPTFLALSPDGKTLIAANELDSFGGVQTGAVSSFRVGGPRLTPVNSTAAQGMGTCHVAVDHTGSCAFAANYTGGSAASFQVGADGRLSAAVSEFHYHFPGKGHGPDADRQEAAHAHRVTVSPENGFVFVNDLGMDCIHIYRLDAATARLTPNDPPQWNATPGSGPRALRFHPSGRWAYCVSELSSTVDVLNWHPDTGRFESVQRLALAPSNYKGVTRASEIVFDSTGQFAYAANRDNNFLATMIVHAHTGKLTLIERSECGGKTPRHIALDPTEQWLLVANQDSDVVSAFRRDAKTGLLAKTGTSFAVSVPQCLVFG